MGFDFFTIQSLAVELASRLEGRLIEQAGSAPEELGLSCGPEEHLHARIGRRGGVCLRPGPLPAALAHCEGAARYLRRARIDKVWAERRERLLCLRLARPDRSGTETYGRLVFELIHPRFQVALLSEQRGQVLGLWAAQAIDRLAVGRPYAPPSGPPRLLPGEDGFEAFAAAMRESGGRLDQILVGADRLVAAQLRRRAGLPDGELIPDKEQLRHLWEVAAALYSRVPQARGFCWRETDHFQFSGLEPARGDREPVLSISQAILLAQAQSRGEEPREGAEIEKRLRQELRALQRRQQAVEADLEEAKQAGDLEKQGNILMAHLGAVKPGAERVELPDVYDLSGQGRVTLELDPRRTPAENGRWFLRTAGKYRRRLALLPGRLKALEEEVGKVEELLQGGEMKRREAEEWLENQGKIRTAKQRGSEKDAAHPRRYRTSTGWSVWAGRNNRENDLLTHRLAARDDLWFHAHGYPGSHVVLRREGRKEEPGAQTLREAASLAAYWSKGKTARKVPVVYTLVKFVSKPRGGAPGQAVIRREKTLMVEPGLLSEEDARITDVM